MGAIDRNRHRQRSSIPTGIKVVRETLPYQTYQDIRLQLQSERISRAVTFRGQRSTIQSMRWKSIEMVKHRRLGILGGTRNYQTTDGLLTLFCSHWHTSTTSNRHRRSQLSPTTTGINTHFDRTYHSTSNHTPKAAQTAQ